MGIKAYSLDLRERIVKAVASGQSKALVAERFGVDLASVKHYVKRSEQGCLAADKRPDQEPWLDAAGLETQGKKQRVSLIAACSLSNATAEQALVVPASVDKDAFLGYLEHSLLPGLEPG